MFKKYGYIVRCGWSDEEMGTAGLPVTLGVPWLIPGEVVVVPVVPVVVPIVLFGRFGF